MTRFLLVADTVHTTAAACDYLAGRLADGDAVTVLAVREPGADADLGGTARLVVAGADVPVVVLPAASFSPPAP